MFKEIIFLFLLMIPVTNSSVMMIGKNEICPEDECYQEYNFKNPIKKILHRIFRFLNFSSSDNFFDIPQEMIDKADKKKTIKINREKYRKLLIEAHAEKKRREQKNLLWRWIYKTKLQTELPNISTHDTNGTSISIIKGIKNMSKNCHPDIIKKIADEVTNDQKKILVSEYEIVQLMPYLEDNGIVYESNPPQYHIKINNKFENFCGKETKIISAYEHFSRMLRLGRIRCNDKPNNKNMHNTQILWYSPRYFKREDVNIEILYGAGGLGLRFRQVINDPEFSKYGSLVKHYDFEKDPHYNFKKPDFLKED